MSQNLDTWKAKLDKALHEKNGFTDVLEKIENKTNVRRLYVVIGLGVFLALYLMIGYGAQFLCNFLGFLYPAYASVKAIESKEKDDDTKWLTYWVVYSMFALLEFFTDIFLFWIPFYWFLKCVFLVYCMAPTSWNGSIMIYFRVIRPFFLKHQKQIDESLERAAETAQGIVNEVFRGIRSADLDVSPAGLAASLGESVAADVASDAMKHHMNDYTKSD